VSVGLEVFRILLMQIGGPRADIDRFGASPLQGKLWKTKLIAAVTIWRPGQWKDLFRRERLWTDWREESRIAEA